MGDNQIDVTIVFDTDTILGLGNASQDPNNPTPVSASYIYMVTDLANVVQTNPPIPLQGNGGGELNIQAYVGNELRWQATSSTLASSHTVALYKFDFLQGDDCLGTPHLGVQQPLSYYPTHPSNPLQFSSYTIHAPYWAADVNAAGSVTYRFYFTILSPGGHALGYYYWDPFIQVSQAQN